MISCAMAEIGGITTVRISSAMIKNATAPIMISGAMAEKAGIIPVRLPDAMTENWI